MKKILLAICIFFGCVIVIFEVCFLLKPAMPFDFGHDRYWIHRTGEPPNSLEGIDRLIENGQLSFELDLVLHEGELYMTHDPLESYSGVPTVRDVLDRLGQRDYRLWLDLKNLTFQNAPTVAEYFHRRLSSKVFFESQSHWGVIRLSRLGVPVSFWLTSYNHSRLIWLRGFTNRLTWVLGNPISVSMHKEEFGPRFAPFFSHIPKLLFTFESKDATTSLTQDSSIRVFLIKSKD